MDPARGSMPTWSSGSPRVRSHHARFAPRRRYANARGRESARPRSVLGLDQALRDDRERSYASSMRSERLSPRLPMCRGSGAPQRIGPKSGAAEERDPTLRPRFSTTAAATSCGELSSRIARASPCSASSRRPEVSETSAGTPRASASMTAIGCVSNSLRSTTSDASESLRAMSSRSSAGTTLISTRSETSSSAANRRNSCSYGPAPAIQSRASGRRRMISGSAARMR